MKTFTWTANGTTPTAPTASATANAASLPPARPQAASAHVDADTAAQVTRTEDVTPVTAEEQAYYDDLHRAHIDRQRLAPLMYPEPGTVTVDTLRRVWKSVHGAQMRSAPASDLTAAAEHLLAFGCSARDDDHFMTYVIRTGALHATLFWSDRGTHREFAVFMEEEGVQAGDVLITIHVHNCATDCFGTADSFLSGLKLT